MLSGKAEEQDIAPPARNNFIFATGKSNIQDAVRKFNKSADLRQKMARRNADSLARFVLS